MKDNEFDQPRTTAFQQLPRSLTALAACPTPAAMASASSLAYQKKLALRVMETLSFAPLPPLFTTP
jgi:hypothetical protein